jgi:hypothetical protein
LQKYLPLLNSAFSSSITESAINMTLKSKLDALRASKSIPSSKNIPVAVAIYSNPELQKQEILSENRGKGGVYR